VAGNENVFGVPVNYSQSEAFKLIIFLPLRKLYGVHNTMFKLLVDLTLKAFCAASDLGLKYQLLTAITTYCTRAGQTDSRALRDGRDLSVLPSLKAY
jgi:hypothetical protein